MLRGPVDLGKLLHPTVTLLPSHSTQSAPPPPPPRPLPLSCLLKEVHNLTWLREAVKRTETSESDRHSGSNPVRPGASSGNPGKSLNLSESQFTHLSNEDTNASFRQ